MAVNGARLDWATIIGEGAAIVRSYSTRVTLRTPRGTVQATVLAVDEEINQITVQTDEVQRLMLFLDPVSLARLHVGTPCLLQVTNGSTRETARPPEHEGAFW